MGGFHEWQSSANENARILGIPSSLFLAECGGSTSQSFNQPPNPTPTIITISPNSAMAGAP